MSSLWFMIGLAVMQAGATAFVWREGNIPLAVVYALYSLSNVALIFVHRG